MVTRVWQQITNSLLQAIHGSASVKPPVRGGLRGNAGYALPVLAGIMAATGFYIAKSHYSTKTRAVAMKQQGTKTAVKTDSKRFRTSMDRHATCMNHILQGESRNLASLIDGSEELDWNSVMGSSGNVEPFGGSTERKLKIYYGPKSSVNGVVRAEARMEYLDPHGNWKNRRLPRSYFLIPDTDHGNEYYGCVVQSDCESDGSGNYKSWSDVFYNEKDLASTVPASAIADISTNYAGVMAWDDPDGGPTSPPTKIYSIPAMGFTPYGNQIKFDMSAKVRVKGTGWTAKLVLASVYWDNGGSAEEILEQTRELASQTIALPDNCTYSSEIELSGNYEVLSDGALSERVRPGREYFAIFDIVLQAPSATQQGCGGLTDPANENKFDITEIEPEITDKLHPGYSPAATPEPYPQGSQTKCF